QSTKIKSEARELIESFPITDENYPLAIESLTERYGRKERYYEEFPKELQDRFYIDNCVTSVQNNAELEIFVESATNVMKEGMLDRRGCESSALSASSESTRSKVLGLIWDKNLNALEIDTEYLEFDEREKITKREILSLVSPVFDPIGCLAPVMIQPKILLQATWKAKESWDEELNNEIKMSFLKWRKQLKYFKNIKIPRWLGVMKESNLSIHTFVDARKDGIIRLVKLGTEKGNILRSIQRLYPKELTPNYEQVTPETQKVREVVTEYPELNTDSNETVPVSRSGREIKPVKRLDL
ncbi:uncharacterized protein CEXT_666791, partial [Caerostris extrusa]